MEAIKREVSLFTDSEFVKKEKGKLPKRFGNPTWLIRCVEITQAREIPYVNAVWRSNGEIRMESLAIGDISDMIEDAYGEQAVYPILKMNLLDFGKPEFREKFLKPYPIVKRRLDKSEKILRNVANKDETKLEIRYDGGEGIVVFYLDSIIEVQELDTDAEARSVQRALSSLKQAYQQIARMS
ncbi:MAG: hypothetical protein JRN59_02765 [Nitrososphaerota archaeon]|jgi:hypothetical protein|nr:hypothetical protein [Nitrososphaerota archaeon]